MGTSFTSTRKAGIVAIVAGLFSLLGSALIAAANPPAPERGLALTPNPPSSEGKVVDKTMTLDSPLSPRDIASLQPASLIMTQGFEGAWPASGWQLNDVSTTDGGEYLWGKRNCHPHTGSFGGWSVGGGAQGGTLPCSDNYPNGVNTGAIYGPFNLSSATSASLTFYFWGSTEGGSNCPFDFFFVGSSINGINFSGQARCGPWTSGTEGNGYYQGILDLSSRLGQSQVWIVFAFVSDDIITDIGITIDDVTLDVSTGGAPTPTRTRTPTPTATALGAATPTRTPTATSTGSAGGSAYLPVVLKQLPPTSTPTATATYAGGNRPPAFPSPFNYSADTEYRYDNLGRLVGATTTITISPASDPDGDSLTYTWSATTGSITGYGLTGVWSRGISYGQVMGGTVTIRAEDGKGGVATVNIVFH